MKGKLIVRGHARRIIKYGVAVLNEGRIRPAHRERFGAAEEATRHLRPRRRGKREKGVREKAEDPLHGHPSALLSMKFTMPAAAQVGLSGETPVQENRFRSSVGHGEHDPAANPHAWHPLSQAASINAVNVVAAVTRSAPPLPRAALILSPTWVMESLPKSPEVAADSGYSKRVSWVAKDSFVGLKVEFHDSAGALLKTLENVEIKLVDPKNKKWQAMSVRVANQQTGHTTHIKVVRLEANTAVSDELFSTRYLEKED